MRIAEALLYSAQMIRSSFFMPSNHTYPSLDSRYALDPEQVERFRADGHVYLPGVASREEVEFFRGPISPYRGRTEGL